VKPEINVLGFLWIFTIMIPNIVFACMYKEGFISQYQNNLVEHLEQIGRFGCFFCMIVIFPQFQIRWISSEGIMLYGCLGSILVVLYCLGWILLWKETSVRKSLVLSILPSILFFLSGILQGYCLLVVFSLVFAPSHIWISYQNAKIYEKVRWADQYPLKCNQNGRR